MSKQALCSFQRSKCCCTRNLQRFDPDFNLLRRHTAFDRMCCANTVPFSTVQGLGFGIAGYAPYRIVSDGTIFAMPENAIGLWPDVGFTFKAAHMKDHAGLLLGLSG